MGLVQPGGTFMYILATHCILSHRMFEPLCSIIYTIAWLAS
jgi:hypothetical protein